MADLNDRANIGNARLAGLEKDLHLKGLMYNVAVAVFFPTYAACMPHETILPHHYTNSECKPKFLRTSSLKKFGRQYGFPQ